MFIQTEETPNPLTLKFIPGIEILKEGTLEFKNLDEAKTNLLANELFKTGKVSNIFLGQDFISITKISDSDWEHIKPNFLSIIMDFFSSGGSLDSQENVKSPKKENIKYTKKELEIVEKIKDLLDQRVKPAVAQDGGDISFVSFKKGVVFLELQGACSGCPSSTMTLKSGIENMLKYYVPEVQSVEPVN